MDNNHFIGTGHNPYGVDIPLGLGNLLAQDPQAMDTFGRMSQQKKTEIISYIQQSQTGAEARQRIETSIKEMHNGCI